MNHRKSKFQICLVRFFLFSHVQLLQQGLHDYAWKDVESTDFIEQATNIVCNDAFKNIEIVRGNFAEICKITESWSIGSLDAFGMIDDNVSLSITELNAKERFVFKLIFF